jgi:hypothetical protein
VCFFAHVLASRTIKQTETAAKWIQENETFKQKVKMPLFFSLVGKEKDKIMYLTMKRCIEFLNDEESELFHRSMSFMFETKEYFILFNKEMTKLDIQVFSSVIE